ncbi:phosphoglycerate kinase, partial [Candidatus Kaiserbacteria bacterium CG10_big_fil_rev_8_21_14_0_10_59_10]
MRCIDEVPLGELKGKRVLVRAGFDVPLNAAGEVSDTFRVRRSAETLQYLKERGARVIVLSHIGREPRETNAPVARALQNILRVHYVADVTGHAARDAAQAVGEGEVLLLENVRSDPREIANDEEFARELASLGELYVSDAFSAAHRAHASIVGVPKFLPSYAGLLMCSEVAALERARAPRSPSFAILGGAKFETKAPLIRSLLDAYDHLFVAGALANDVLKAQGFPIGRSLISKEAPGPDVLGHPHFVPPVDVVAENLDGQARTIAPAAVAQDEKIVDIGPDSVALVAPLIEEANFILWNGP